ncbi:MAG: cation-transporting P-type ATPase, partial [Minwuiales bacterium]|nr:cation-transporting P-type ATPase [Minwuiales bacterium]
MSQIPVDSPAGPDIHRRPLRDLFHDIGGSEAGLTGAEAETRLRQFGLNELRVRKNTPEIVKFLREFKNFFAILLIAGGCLALLADYLDPGQGNLYIAYALFG